MSNEKQEPEQIKKIQDYKLGDIFFYDEVMKSAMQELNDNKEYRDLRIELNHIYSQRMLLTSYKNFVINHYIDTDKNKYNEQEIELQKKEQELYNRQKTIEDKKIAEAFDYLIKKFIL